MRPSILLVDDELDMLHYLGHLLEEHYIVHQATNGRIAIRLLQTEVIQLVVSDVMMPEMDGFALCQTIKSTVELSHIPIILLTAKNTLQAKVAGLELGADAYIEKPFSKEHLVAQIHSLLMNRQKIGKFFRESPLLHLQQIAQSKSDELFLEALGRIILEDISNDEIDVNTLARKLNMSRMSFYRKLKAISDLSPMEFVHTVRLKRSAELLASGDYKINEVAYLLGYSSPSNFTRLFIRQFGINPSAFLKRLGDS